MSSIRVLIILSITRFASTNTDFDEDPRTRALLALKERLHRGTSLGVASLASLTMSSSSPHPNSIPIKEKKTPHTGFFDCLEDNIKDFNRMDLSWTEAPFVKCTSEAIFGEKLQIFPIKNATKEREEWRSKFKNKSWLDSLEEASRSFGIRIPLLSGLGLRISRSSRDPESIELTLDLDKSLYFYGNEDEISEDDEFTKEEELIEGRGQNKKRQKNFFKKIVPLLSIPVLIQAAVVPLFLKFLSTMVFKAMVIGKLALFLVAFNNLRFRANQTQEQVFHQNMAYYHYGYDGGPEYGSYVNSSGGKKRRRR